MNHANPDFSKSSFMLRLGVLITSLTQALSPLLSSLNDESASANSYTNPKITPAGYAFAVWGVITTLSWIYGFYQLRKGLKNESLHLKVAPYLIAIYICFSVWLFAAEYQWLIATVAIFIVMYLLLARVLTFVNAEREQLTTTGKLLLLTQIGIYAGWTAVAIFANIASAVKFYGYSDEGTFGDIWQASLLFLATLNILIGIHLFKGNIAFIATTLWAVVGVYVGLQNEYNPEVLESVTIVLGAIVIGYAGLYWFCRLRASGSVTIS
jgi:hypothetical protein